jgi:diaminopropionate ammonia-lyase
VLQVRGATAGIGRLSQFWRPPVATCQPKRHACGMPEFSLFMNPRHGTPGTVTLPATGFRRARTEITSWDGYAPTPLRDLAMPGMVRFKDEAGRFGLGSFKVLGSAYAVVNLLADELARQNIAPSAGSADLAAGRHAEATQRITITSATDGNHGRAVAWAAARFHCRCVIYLHETVSPGRQAAIVAFGAEVRRVPGTYDDAVRACARDAVTHGWFIVSDTSWPGYTEVPRDIMQGYRLMADEAVDQWTGPPPTHVFIQGGVGGAAAAVAAQMRAQWGEGQGQEPALVVVEPDRAACLLASARAGRITTVTGNLDTIMAGLACGEPSLLAWQELERSASAFMAIPDVSAIDTMRFLAGLGVVAGESGVAGLAAMRLAMADPDACEALGLGPERRVLVFGTEGATDTLLYESLIHGAPA